MYRHCLQKNCCNYSCNNDVNNWDCNNKSYMEEDCSYVQNANDYYEPCNCGFDEGESYFPESPVFGQSYVPIQQMNKTFTPCVGLKMGTIFPELVSPYMPGQSQREISYIEATNKIKGGCNQC